MILLAFEVCLIFVINMKVDASILHMCPGESFHKKFTNEARSIVIPASLMSHFQSTEFRLQPSLTFPCEMNYEVVQISLLESKDTGKAKTSPSPYIENTLVYGNTLEPDNETSTSTELTILPIGTTYTVDNFTNEDENNTEMCERKLNRNEFQFTPYGILYHSGEYYRPDEYCILSYDAGLRINDHPHELTVRKCNVECRNDRTPCIPLCCHLHEHIDLTAQCCQEIAGLGQTFQPAIYDKLNQRLSLQPIARNRNLEKNHTMEYEVVNNDKRVTPHYITFKYFHTCPDGMGPLELFFNENGDSDLNTRVQITNDGKAMYVGQDRHWHSLENYCISGIANADNFRDDLKKMTTILYYCPEPEVQQREVSIRSYLLVALFSVSSVFLLVTVIVYALLWDKQNIHGWTIMSFVTSEFFLFVFIAISYSLFLFYTADEVSGTVLCKTSAILSHFFFLATFSWLTMINLDLWWTFKSLTPVSERSKGKKRFALYTIFGWGLPVLVISVALSLQTIYADNASNVIVPDYGHKECFISKYAKGVYLYYIVGALLFVNSILISLTFFTIYKFKKGARMASTSSSKSKERSFKLFFKLVIVMGATWILEFVAWLIENEENLFWIYVAFDVLILSQSVATFIIFVCKRKILNQLEQTHPSLKLIIRPILTWLGTPATGGALSSSGKQTRSTTAGSMSTSQGNRNKSVTSKRSSTKMSV